ncbi:MAG: hypothetical protein Q4F31_08110 [Eubacteriales bacterium]|nr:hypothetical protein [Eubacteriales bacterium]
MTNFIDKFCRKHPNFGIPHLMKYLTIANVIMWVVNMINYRVLSYMSFNPYMILHGQVWRLISFIFIPPSSGMLAIISFYFYYLIGNTLEANWGTAKFNLYFFTGVVLSIICGFILYLFRINISLNAHYIYLSLFFSFAALFPDMQVLLFFIIPIKMKWLAIVDAVYFVMGIISLPFPTNLVPVIAVLNFAIFCYDDLLYSLGIRKNRNGFGGGRSGARTIIFKKEAERIRREQASSLYNHKCSVCGKTDTDNPGLEFRFCSKCAGYHCFCQEHINNHIHFTE